MVRIVSDGPDPSVIKRVTCPNCGAVLEYVPNDVKKNKYRDYDGTVDTAYWITCPKCNKDIVVRTS